MATLIKGVLYLQRDRFQLSIENRADIITYTFPTNFVNNLDILDADGLKQNLSEFIKQSKVILTHIIIVLSTGVIFEKDFKTEEESKVQEFLDNVPYETISIKKVPITGGTKILVGNATFYNLLADVFLTNGVFLDFVIPEIALGAPIDAFSASTARYILTQSEALSQYKFIVDASTDNIYEAAPHREQKQTNKKNSSLIYLLPVMGVLLIILLFIILKPFFIKDKPKTDVLPPLPIVSRTPTAIPSQTANSTVPTNIPLTPSIDQSSPEAGLKKPSSAQIIYDPTSAAKAEGVRKGLSSLGITNIQAVASPSDISVPIVVVAGGIDPSEKQKVLNEIRKVLPSLTQQDTASQPVDISVTIGKSS